MNETKKRIIEETARQQSYLIGNFNKPNANIVIPSWAAVSVSDPSFLSFIGKEIGNLIKNLERVDLICGISTTGISLAAATSISTGIPWVFARGERKSYGSKEAFDGTYHRGAHIIFVDNLSAKGKGMIPVFESAAEEGFIFSNLIVIVDYDKWLKVDQFKKHNVNVLSLITVDELTDGLNELGYFPGETYSYIKQFLKEPGEWNSESEKVKSFMSELEKYKDRPYIKILN